MPAPDVPRRRPDRRGGARALERRRKDARPRAGRRAARRTSGSRTREARARDYPHQFSGGMRQRAMIAMALVHNPDVLIADEPTTALDVTVQAQILELIDEVKREFDIGVILITHDLGVVAETANSVMVMYAGRAMEYGPAARDLRAAAAPVHVGPARVDADDRAPARVAACRSRARRRRCSTRRPAARSIRAARTASSPATRSGRRSSRRCPAAIPTPATCRAEQKRRARWQRAVAASVGRRRMSDARRRRRPMPSSVGDTLVELEHLTKHFPVRQGVFARGKAEVHAVEDVSLTRAPRRDARDRRRVRLRQVDDRAPDPAPARPDRPARSASTAGTSRASRSASCGRCGARCR